MNFKTLDDYDFRDKKVLLRLDLNSPVRKGKLVESVRFSASVETIKELLIKNAKVVVIAHQGRKGDNDFLESLEQHSKILSRLLGLKVSYVDDFFGREARKK